MRDRRESIEREGSPRSPEPLTLRPGRWRPATTRSRMRSRSNSAIAPRMCIWSLPAGVVASMPSPRLTNADAERLQLVEQRDQVLEVAPEPIESPAHQHVEPAPLGIGQELIERRATILRPAHPAIDVLDRRPASGADVPPQLLQLVLRLLVDGAHPRVDGRLHASTSPAVAAPAFRI